MRQAGARLLLASTLAAGLQQAAAAQDDCVRSAPSPVAPASRAGIRSHSFTPTSSHEAVERFIVGSGVQVEVRHGGCEYYVTSFRFTSPSLFADGHTARKAYAQAAALLRELDRIGMDTGFVLGLAARTLDARARARSAPALEEELAVEGDGEPPLQGQVKVDAAGRQGKAGFVQVTLLKGPL